jgi:formate hydrogenlyase subunit 4
MNPLVGAIVGSVGGVALAMAAAPLLEGVMRKVTARVQSRKGPPLVQPYLDIGKLLIKEDIEVGHTRVLQRFSAVLSLAAMLSVVLFLPIAGSAPLAEGADAIQMIYILTLGGIAVLLAALSAGSTYSLVGMSREMMAMMTLEPLFAVAVVMAAVKAGSLRLDQVFGGAVYQGGLVSGLLLLGVMLFAFQAFVGRAPFDLTEAETEIMEGPLIEYSGPKLALFKYAHMVKLFVYAGLFTALFVPRVPAAGPLLNLAVFLVCQLLLVILATVVAATHGRYRIDQVVRYYVVLFLTALGSLVLALFGW